MSQKEVLSVGELTVRSIKAPVELVKDVTQITSRATGVTANGVRGSITTDVSSLAAGAEATFTVTNNRVTADSIPVIALKTPSATGLSQAFVSKVIDGSFDITLTNLHATTADTSASVIGYFIVNGKSN